MRVQIKYLNFGNYVCKHNVSKIKYTFIYIYFLLETYIVECIYLMLTIKSQEK